MDKRNRYTVYYQGKAYIVSHVGSQHEALLALADAVAWAVEHQKQQLLDRGLDLSNISYISLRDIFESIPVANLNRYHVSIESAESACAINADEINFAPDVTIQARLRYKEKE